MSTKLSPAFTFSGLVIDGEKVGRTIGFPTANLDRSPAAEQLPLGVYLGTCQTANDTQEYSCLVYFGPRYIFGEKKNNFEVYIYDFSESIYGQVLSVTLTYFLRAPINITSLDELQKQLAQDKKEGEKLL